MSLLQKVRYLTCFGSMVLFGVVLFAIPASLNITGEVSFYVARASWFSDGVAQGVSWVLGALIGMFEALLVLVGIFFDASLSFSILDFGKNYVTLFESGVLKTWMSFRDIANILLIVIFVFIAFNVILGLEKYGLKNLGAKLIVIAVLLNFSLFFTQSVVDISNLLATSFYDAIQITGDGGISDHIIDYSGMTGWNSDTLFNVDAGHDGSWTGKVFLLALVTIVLFVAVSAVLVFATILLLTRMIVLVVLMLTSPLAFAAMITPTLEQWWGKWIGALLKNVIFAPLFMLLLWATLNITTTTTTNATRGTLVDTIQGTGSFSALFSVIIIVGLLYASTKIASELSIMGAGIATSAGLGLASRTFVRPAAALTAGSVALLSRGTLGRGSARMAESNWAKQKAASGGWMSRTFARSYLSAGEAGVKATYDARNSKAAKTAAKTSGLSFGAPINSYSKHVDEEVKILKAGIEAMVESDKKKVEKTEASGPGSAENITRGVSSADTTSSSVPDATGDTNTTNQNQSTPTTQGQRTQLELDEIRNRIEAGTQRASAGNEKERNTENHAVKSRYLDDYRNRRNAWESMVGNAKREGRVIQWVVSPNSTRQRIADKAAKSMNETPEEKAKREFLDLQRVVNKMEAGNKDD